MVILPLSLFYGIFRWSPVADIYRWWAYARLRCLRKDTPGEGFAPLCFFESLKIVKCAVFYVRLCEFGKFPSKYFAEIHSVILMVKHADNSLGLAKFRADGYEVVCLASPAYFYAVGQQYRRFGQTHEEVISLLQKARDEWMGNASASTEKSR